MQTLLIALGAGVAFIIAYHTYGRWLGHKVFNLAAGFVCPSHRLRDDVDYVPTPKPVVFGHHFTSIAGTGPIVGPAIAVMWGWVPALLWVVFGSIFIGAVHDFGALVVSLRNNGQSVGDIAGRVLNKRVRLLFLLILVMALTIVLAIFGMVIGNVFKMYPASIFPVWIQIPIAVGIGTWLHKRGKGLFWPSIVALALMYLTVVFGDDNFLVAQISWMPEWLSRIIAPIESGLHTFNTWAAGFPVIAWVAILLIYAWIASVLPVWSLLQPRDYINSLQLISALGLIVVGLFAAALFGGAPPVEGAARPALTVVAPAWNTSPPGAPAMLPFLFITIACGAISGFHCLVSSGTSSKQIDKEPDARFVGYGSMLTEGFLAVIVILACVAGLSMGVRGGDGAVLTGDAAWAARYASWQSAGGLARTVSAFVDGSANFVQAMGIPGGVAVALMGVLVASFAGTTMDTACRLQRYVIQELAATFSPSVSPTACGACGYDLEFNVSGKCPECGTPIDHSRNRAKHRGITSNPITWFTNMHIATIAAVVSATAMAALPAPGAAWTWANAGKGGLVLWPLFGATNQLLGGLSFLVIAFYLWRRKKPVWFIVLPMILMLVMPAWAMISQLPEWISPAKNPDGTTPAPNVVLIIVAFATLALEVWMVVEALMLFPKVKGVLEPQLPGVDVAVEAGAS